MSKIRLSNTFAWMMCSIIGLMLFSGCTHFRAELAPPPLETAIMQPVPIIVGAHFTEALRKYEATYEWGDALGFREVYIFPIGDASVNLLQNAMRLVFYKFLTVESIFDSGKNITARRILSFDIDKVHIFLGRGFGRTSHVDVAYRIRAYDMQGREELNWTVTGTAETTLSPSLSRPPPHLIQAVEMAMRNAGEKFMSSFRELPEVQRWVESIQRE